MLAIAPRHVGLLTAATFALASGTAWADQPHFAGPVKNEIKCYNNYGQYGSCKDVVSGKVAGLAKGNDGLTVQASAKTATLLVCKKDRKYYYPTVKKSYVSTSEDVPEDAKGNYDFYIELPYPKADVKCPRYYEKKTACIVYKEKKVKLVKEKEYDYKGEYDILDKKDTYPTSNSIVFLKDFHKKCEELKYSDYR